jgi:hypothetical protein
MLIRTRLFELELHAALLYVRLGRADACLARGHGLTLSRLPHSSS